MTLADVKKLSDEKLRLRVAELLGKQGLHGRAYGNPHFYRATERGCGMYEMLPSGVVQLVPHYATDLNAMREAERTALPADPNTPEWHAYMAWLCGDDTKNIFDQSVAEWVMAVSATARQRAEALVLTLEEKE